MHLETRITGDNFSHLGTLISAVTVFPTVYAIDSSLTTADSPASTDNEGHRLETAVCLELHRHHPLLRTYGISGYETKNGNSVDVCAEGTLENVNFVSTK